MGREVSPQTAEPTTKPVVEAGGLLASVGASSPRAGRIASGPSAIAAEMTRLQRTIGNRATTNLVASGKSPIRTHVTVARGIVHRKYADLDLTTAETDLGVKIAGLLQRYNAGPELSTLAVGARRAQIDKDSYLLDAIVSEIYEQHGETRNTWVEKVVGAQQLVKSARMGLEQEALRVETKRAPITFSAFPEMARPEAGKSIMPNVDYIEATIDGTVYRLRAGQNYLNAGYSSSLYDTPPTKQGDVDVYVSDQQLNPGFKTAVIGDAHHRFIWGGHHGQPMTANLIPRGYPQKDYAWSALTYEHNPKHVFKFDLTNPILVKLFNAAISPLPEYAGRYDVNPLEFIKAVIKGLLAIPEVIFERDDADKIVKYIGPQVSAADPTPYSETVNKLKMAATNKEHAASMADVLLESFAAGEAPDVALGATPSIGYYSPDYHVVVLDPVKNPTPDALIDTLAFEVGNAQRRDEFLANKKATATIEFDTMKDYIKLLTEATHSGDINGLVIALGISSKYLVQEDAKTVLSAKEPALDMPVDGELPGQKLRSALAWWKMQDWTEAQREKYFTASAHGAGMKATGAGYGSDENAKPTVTAKAGGAAKPSLHVTVQAIARVYPRADQHHFDGLAPRHYGEFLLTGRIEKWHAEPRKGEQKAEPQETCLVAFHRDLKETYPNYDDDHMQPLTYTDYGDFLLDGKIKSWEKMSA